MKIIGLTGGIASGKTTVAAIFERLGAPVVDADKLAREVVEPGTPGHAAIVEAFGPQVLAADGSIDRAALGCIVFRNPEARKILEGVTHPAIGSRAVALLEKLRSEGHPVVFYVAPLLIEAGITSRVDEVWVVYVDAATQVLRLMERDRITREEAERKIACQMPIEEKRKHAKVVIDNGGSREDTERTVWALWEEIMGGTRI